MMKKVLKKEAKRLYILGKSDVDIASELGVTPRTIYNWRKKNGDLWLTERLEASTSKDDIEEKEKLFLMMLINSFETNFSYLQEKPLNPKEAGVKLQLTEKYAKAYWKLKAPGVKRGKVNRIDVVKEVLKVLSELAKEKKEYKVINFLSDNADEIAAMIIKNRKS